MSLAAEWRGAPGQPARQPRRPDLRRKESKSQVQKERQRAQASRQRKLLFTCFISIAALISAILIFSVFLRVMIAQNEVRVREVEKQIELEKRQQEGIKVEIAGLESPSRIEKIAVDKLQMTRVPWAAYVQTPAYKDARSSERQKLSDKEAAAGDATQGG
jgi:cell division protein FtsL